MVTKAEKLEAIESLKTALRDCGEHGNAMVYIIWVGGGPTPTGRTDYYDVRTFATGTHGAPEPMLWLSFNLARAIGWRFNDRREAVSLGGCGYSKTYEIAQALARIAGHSVRVYANGGMGSPSGLVDCPRTAGRS